MSRLVLIGPRGAGKSSAGSAVAQRLGWAWLDTDALVEERGVGIAELFRLGGEAAFRAIESDVIARLDPPGQAVIATGGGAVLAGPNRQRLGALGHVVYLWARPGVLALRLAGAGRPPLSTATPIAELEQTMMVRDPIYRGLAAQVVDTSDLALEVVVARLLMALP